MPQQDRIPARDAQGLRNSRKMHKQSNLERDPQLEGFTPHFLVSQADRPDQLADLVREKSYLQGHVSLESLRKAGRSQQGGHKAIAQFVAHTERVLTSPRRKLEKGSEAYNDAVRRILSGKW